jgi:small subunit ribosomal protein S2
MCRVIADAVEEGRYIASRRGGGGGGPAAPVKRDAEQEAAIAAQQAEARRQAAAAAKERDRRIAAERTARTGEGADSSATGVAAPDEPAPTSGPVATQDDLTPDKVEQLLDDKTSAPDPTPEES